MSEQPQVFLGMTAIVESREMREVMSLVERAARTAAAVLITGETGVGKEIVARAIHHYSFRAAGPWVDFNCAALPEHLVESELFGHERGAFSGAERAKAGLFELADGGTLFLDEVGELEPRMQARLLRVLDGVPYYRIGGQKKVAVDVRVVAATNRRLDQETLSGGFRSDLYYRLAQCEVRVPPLRARRGDILPLAEFFLSQHDGDRRFSDSARRRLERYDWPGNVRELRNAVTRACIEATGAWIEAADLRLAEVAPERAPAVASALIEHRLESLGLNAMERQAILTALETTGGHHQRTADLLGISVRTLSRKLKSYQSEAEVSPQREQSYYAR